MTRDRRLAQPFLVVLPVLMVMLSLSAPGLAKVASPPRTNIIMIDKEGEAIDPATFERLRDEKTGIDGYGPYIEAIFSDIDAFCQNRKPCKVLFYFHGGLNSQESSVERADELADRIRKEGVYPIFVNWRSSLVSTWWDHVANIRSGFKVDGSEVFAPYFIAADEVKAIAEAPRAWWAEVRHTFPRRQGAGKLALSTYERMVDEGSIPVNKLLDPSADKPRLLDERTQGEKWLPRGTVILTAPTKLLGAPLVIQGGGTGAWDVMQRRTLMLFRTEAEFRFSPEVIEEARTTKADVGPIVEKARKYDVGGAFAYFINRFETEFLPQYCTSQTYSPAPTRKQEEPKSHEEGSERGSCPDLLELSLVGHSMGAIIIDRLLRYAPNLEVRNIVFMGAATSVEDYRDTVDAYLDRHNGDGNPIRGPRMYHLVLHPYAESTERNFLDLAPRGSLLVWIDNYFTEPISPLGRRVGRFSNIVPELRFAEDEIRKRIHLKVFRLERKYRCWNPRKHGDFGNFPFWDERFWDPATPIDETSPVQRFRGGGCQ